jgi:serine/threonine protein phosphatase PrpC
LHDKPFSFILYLNSMTEPVGDIPPPISEERKKNEGHVYGSARTPSGAPLVPSIPRATDAEHTGRPITKREISHPDRGMGGIESTADTDAPRKAVIAQPTEGTAMYTGVLVADRRYPLTTADADVNRLVERITRAGYVAENAVDSIFRSLAFEASTEQPPNGAIVARYLLYSPAEPNTRKPTLVTEVSGEGTRVILARNNSPVDLSPREAVEGMPDIQNFDRTGSFDTIGPTLRKGETPTTGPSIKQVPLTPEDTRVLVADDAVWNAISPQDAINLTHEITDPLEAAKRLEEEARRLGATGNLGIAILNLQ